MDVIIVSGTPATGKTTLAKKIAKKLNLRYFDVNKIIKKYDISEGYDKKRKTKIVGVNKLNKVLIKEIKQYKKILNNNKDMENGIIIDSHLSHYLPKKYVDLCIVTKCDLRVLKRRLKKKNYSKDKLRENLDVEIFDVCLNEARENGHNVIVINTTKGINIKEISNKIGGLIDVK